MDVRIGTSGWTYKHWRGTFYPDELRVKDQFDYYAERFDTVELNGSHYRWPADGTVEGWRGRMPDGFEMAVKASRYLTHFRKLGDPQDWVERITHTMDLLDHHGAGFVVSVIAEQEPIVRAAGRLAYVRFHNADPNWRYGGSFSDEELAAWVPRLAELTDGDRPAYVYFNNDNHGHAAFNGLTLRRMLDDRRLLDDAGE